MLDYIREKEIEEIAETTMVKESLLIYDLQSTWINSCFFA